MTIIAVVSDTHCLNWSEVHPDIKAVLADADIAVHCGDFSRMNIVDGVRECSKRAVVVHGNSDPIEIRRAIPYIDVIQIEGLRIGVTHPAWGGPEFEPEELLPDFSEPVDAILFGHLHETLNESRNGVHYINPGQGYSSFMVPATMAIVTIEDGVITAEIRHIEAAR